ncbi:MULTISPECIES: hypothetical protein [unclassified Kitasatospora]|nr:MULTISPECIES: hypothetical protein [unclassified Kitasatospora]
MRVFTDNDHDGYGLEITHEGRTVTYDAGHSTREVHAFLTLLT